VPDQLLHRPRLKRIKKKIFEMEHHNKPLWQQDNFGRFVRFGVVDQSILLVSILAGFSFDAAISRRIGAKVSSVATTLTH
jgi:hypothetical protein